VVLARLKPCPFEVVVDFDIGGAAGFGTAEESAEKVPRL